MLTVYAIFYDQSSNDTLTNDIVHFEQLGQDFYSDLKECFGNTEVLEQSKEPVTCYKRLQ